MPAQFITGNELNHELSKLFESAERRLVLISPYISLHERYASELKRKLSEDKLEISVVFGKNEENPSKSMRREDLEFFMQFPNIEIRYEPRLHAKYYASDGVALITSMNLYRYSQDHNIEGGVLITLPSLLANLANRIAEKDTLDEQAYGYFNNVVIQQAQLLYKKEPRYESAILGLSKKYVRSEVTTDRVAEFFSNEKAFAKPATPPRPKAEPKSEPRPEPIITSAPAPGEQRGQSTTGYCIRTGAKIPFNVQKPLSYEAYKAWSKDGNKENPEKYCHFSGEPSNGETSVSKPILKKNWKKAKEIFDL